MEKVNSIASTQEQPQNIKNKLLPLGIQEKEPECKGVFKEHTLLYLCFIRDEDSNYNPLSWFVFTNKSFTKIYRFRQNKVVSHSPRFIKMSEVKIGINEEDEIVSLYFNEEEKHVKIFFEKPNRILEYNYNTRELKKLN